MHLPLGIYEQIVNLATQSGLRTLGPGKETELVPLDGEAAGGCVQSPHRAHGRTHRRR